MLDDDRTPKPGEYVKAGPTWRTDDELHAGARVDGTDGTLGTLRARHVGVEPEGAYLEVETDEGAMFVPERLVRETRPGQVLLTLPVADVKANASHGQPPVQPDPTELPREPR